MKKTEDQANCRWVGNTAARPAGGKPVSALLIGPSPPSAVAADDQVIWSFPCLLTVDIEMVGGTVREENREVY